MSAYAAVISLKNTINDILHSCRLSLVPPSLQIIQVVYEELRPWVRILERLDKTSKSKSRNKVNALDGQIKETLWKFEENLEYLLSHQISFQSAERDVLKLFSIDLRSLQDDVDSFIHTLNDLKKEYIYEADNMPEDEDEDESSISSSTSSSIAAGTSGETTKSKMIGFSHQFEKLKRNLLDDDDKYLGLTSSAAGTFGETIEHFIGFLTHTFGRNIKGFGLTGMAGVGKTRLAREIYEDPQVRSYFDFRLWITVGRISSARLLNQLEEVSQSILAELKGDEKCLVVLDDVWEMTEELSSLLTSIVRMENTIIRILLTARDLNVIEYVRESICYNIDPEVVRLLNDEESKDLLCLKVFGENIICPHQLDKAATKIAKKCEGLPLTIVTVADILSKAQNRDDLEYWEDVAEERNSVFADAYNQISKVLFPTYDYLPQRLKMPFLYMSVFPRDDEIPPSKIINMLKAEGWFLDPNRQGSVDYDITECLQHLCTSHFLVLFKLKSSRWWFTNRAELDTIKTCRLHSAWRQLCRGEARKNKFFHVLYRLVDASKESIKGQRCLCLENNLLFGITEFCNLVRCSNCASTTRSLLFLGPYQQYPTPIDAIGFKLLRELNALQLRFYTFPTQVLTLVLLKYLALTCNGQLPSTISKLFNLKVLIIHPHMSITKCGDNTAPSSSYDSYIPIEIWDMKELEHIEILGKSFLVAPPNYDDDVDVDVDEVHDDDVDVDEVHEDDDDEVHEDDDDDVDVDVDEVHEDDDDDDDDDDDVDVDEVHDDEDEDDDDGEVANSLKKVSTVVGVNAASVCTITKRIPNVRKLGVQMEVTPYDDVCYSSELILSCFPHISTLRGLETLKCSIINPVLKYGYVAPSSPRSSSPRSLMFPRVILSCFHRISTFERLKKPKCSVINPVLRMYRNVAPPRSVMFPRGLIKLHLSGMGFPWGYMDAIGSLPYLEVLKLRSYAFRGSKWETQGNSFFSLRYLLIEDSDLVQWKPASESFPRLRYLSLKHCYKLEELHWPSDSRDVGKIELVDCNPLGVGCANKLPGKVGKHLSVTASDHYLKG